MTGQVSTQPIRKIVAIGSSATRGFKIKQEDAWPEQLERICREEGWDVAVSNKATHGLALAAFAERILHLEKTDPQDLYLLQLPIPHRIYFGVNGARRLKEETYEKDVVLGWSEKNSHVSPTRILMTTGALDEQSPFHKYLLSFFFPIIKRNNPAVTIGEFMAYLSFWEANIRESDLELINYVKEIVLLQQIMLRICKPYCMFQWCGQGLNQFADRADLFYSLIDWTRFIKGGESTVIDYLKLVHRSRYPELLNDEYHHLNRAGNHVVAKELVFPCIERWKPAPLCEPDRSASVRV